jgi:hypothetical protein
MDIFKNNMPSYIYEVLDSSDIDSALEKHNPKTANKLINVVIREILEAFINDFCDLWRYELNEYDLWLEENDIYNKPIRQRLLDSICINGLDSDIDRSIILESDLDDCIKTSFSMNFN